MPNEATEKEPKGFGLVPLKGPGPLHPRDMYIHCGCAKCEEQWQLQLKAYRDYYGDAEADAVGDR